MRYRCLARIEAYQVSLSSRARVRRSSLIFSDIPEPYFRHPLLIWQTFDDLEAIRTEPPPPAHDNFFDLMMTMRAAPAGLAFPGLSQKNRSTIAQDGRSQSSGPVLMNGFLSGSRYSASSSSRSCLASLLAASTISLAVSAPTSSSSA